MHINMTWSSRVCVGVVFLCLLCACLPSFIHHLEVNWPTTLCKNKDGGRFFTFNFECHNRYKKLLLCNSENSDIAWCNKNNSEWDFSVFFEKRTKSCFFLKKEKKQFFFKKTKNPGELFFLKKPRFFSTLIADGHSLRWYVSAFLRFLLILKFPVTTGGY